MSKELSEMTLQELWQLFPIFLTPFSENWVAWYKEEEERLSKLFSGVIVRISHIGSTSFGTILAKPIIDILVENAQSTDLSNAKKILCENGYCLMAEEGSRIDFNKGYTKNGFAEKVFHLHLRLLGDNDELYFRDYMKAFPKAAKEYEALKASLWKKFTHDRDGYTAGKTDFVRAHTLQAKALYKNRYVQVEKTEF